MQNGAYRTCFVNIQEVTNVRHGITLQMFVFLHFERKKDLHN